MDTNTKVEPVATIDKEGRLKYIIPGNMGGEFPIANEFTTDGTQDVNQDFVEYDTRPEEYPTTDTDTGYDNSSYVQ